MSSLTESAAPAATTEPARRRRRLPAVPTGLRVVLEPLLFAVVVSVWFLGSSPADKFTVTTGVIYALLTLSIGILFGWAGMPTFGHALFFGIGVYTLGLLVDREWSPLLLVVAAATCAGLAALVLSALGSRVVRVEFAMLTLVIGQVGYLLTFKIDALGGDDGLYGVTRGEVLGRPTATPDDFWWYVLAVVVVGLAVLRRIHLSPFGAALGAVRDDPVRAAALGIPVKGMRIAAFTLAGATAGVAGALYVQQQGIATPTTLQFTFSGQIIIMGLLGGMRYFWGPPVGAMVFVWLNSLVFSETSHATLVLGLILLVIVVVFRDGLIGLPLQARRLWRRLAAGRRSS